MWKVIKSVKNQEVINKIFKDKFKRKILKEV